MSRPALLPDQAGNKHCKHPLSFLAFFPSLHLLISLHRLTSSTFVSLHHDLHAPFTRLVILSLRAHKTNHIRTVFRFHTRRRPRDSNRNRCTTGTGALDKTSPRLLPRPPTHPPGLSRRAVLPSRDRSCRGARAGFTLSCCVAGDFRGGLFACRGGFQ